MARVPKITDVGEKIGLAAKDTRGVALTREAIALMTPIEKAKRVTKANLWPEPDYLALVAGGMTPEAAMLLKLIRGQVASKPIMKWSAQTPDAQTAAIEAYADILTALEPAAKACRTIEDVGALRGVAAIAVGGVRTPGGTTERIILERTQQKRLWSIQAKRRVAPLDVTPELRALARKWNETFDPSVPEWKRGWRVRESRSGGYIADTIDRMFVQRLDANGQPLPGAAGVVEMPNMRRQDLRPFPTMDEAWSALEARSLDLAGQNVSPQAPARERRKPEQAITRAHLAAITRIGPDVRAGRDILANELMAEFGFRAVEFGEWLPMRERQEVLNHAWDAFSDLAEVIGVAHHDIGLGGLAVAFGSRGKSAFSAHYEPDRHVFNLTRLSGAGFIAHEYAHALDHWVYERDHGLRVVNAHAIFASSLDRARPLDDAHHDGISNAWRDVISTMHRKDRPVAEFNDRVREYYPGEITDEVEATLVADPGSRIPVSDFVAKRLQVDTDYHRQAMRSRKHAYYASDREMYARAFECWVSDTLTAHGRTSDYLVHSVDEDFWQVADLSFNPYPAGQERTIINAAIARTIETSLASQRTLASRGEMTMFSPEHSALVEPKDAPGDNAPTPVASSDTVQTNADPEAERKQRIVPIIAWQTLVAAGIAPADLISAATCSPDEVAGIAAYLTVALPETAGHASQRDAEDALKVGLLLNRLDVAEELEASLIQNVNEKANPAVVDFLSPAHREGLAACLQERADEARRQSLFAQQQTPAVDARHGR